ncbi:MAG: NAD(P)H-dependent oxidoreductase [Paracoccus sp. (in: a-proteobacteria)]|uniref:NADPH-dependent FMN reductase n=1 Tax=Paracoccus sp. TaxID=267 RepID=UPI0026DEC2DE|nr:NAD(P)H-dependent oxidoreductase [Paracoccus sp. (in: a-proteobacteria)]MDO5622081.1 NAD(P)H-dependent oxidoreductase [Paracoccus sp. (in: a-proteobacteria)]
MTKTVAVLIGSLRKDSLNRKLAQALEKLAKGKLEFDYIELADLPHYNEDLWDNPPASVVTLKERIGTADGVLFLTPEYNRHFPGVLKDALDWGSRPYGNNSWSGKPAAVTGTSPGAIGAAVGQVQLRNAILHLNMHVMQQPEAYIQWRDEAFAADGSITDDGTRKFLQGFIDAFATHIGKIG